MIVLVCRRWRRALEPGAYRSTFSPKHRGWQQCLWSQNVPSYTLGDESGRFLTLMTEVIKFIISPSVPRASGECASDQHCATGLAACKPGSVRVSLTVSEVLGKPSARGRPVGNRLSAGEEEAQLLLLPHLVLVEDYFRRAQRWGRINVRHSSRA